MGKFLGQLSPEQVAVASYIHDVLMPQWAEADRRLDELRARKPGFDEATALEKTRAINRYYFARHPNPRLAAQRIATIMREPPDDPIEIVERIAPLERRGQVRYHFSFASKFGHFFIDPERIPIYDAWALEAIKYHFGWVPAERSRMYRMFAERVYRLREASGLSCSLRELDRYLWLSGMYRAWITAADPTRLGLSGEVSTVFRNYGHVAMKLLREEDGDKARPACAPLTKPAVREEGLTMARQRLPERIAHWPPAARRRAADLERLCEEHKWDLHPLLKPANRSEYVTFNRRAGRSRICFQVDMRGRVYIKFVTEHDVGRKQLGLWHFKFASEGPDNYCAVASSEEPGASVGDLERLLEKAYQELQKRS